jgi:elongation factor G
MTTELAQFRNIGIIAHIDAGKTTTTECILFNSGYTRALGAVDEGTAVTDWWEEEREPGITIKTAAITTRWRNMVTGAEAQINIINMPGHIAFTAEVQRSLPALDGDVVFLGERRRVNPSDGHQRRHPYLTTPCNTAAVS